MQVFLKKNGFFTIKDLTKDMASVKDEEKKFEDVSRKSEQNKVYINLLIGVLIILLILLIWIFIRKK